MTSPGSPGSSRVPDQSKRKALRAIGVVVAAGGIAVLGSSLLRPVALASGQASTQTTATSVGTDGKSSVTYSRIKVMYFQMPSTVTGTKEEYYVLPDPSDYSVLLRAILAAHPALDRMLPTMLVLVDGLVADSGTPLANGDEVDFIPSMVGG